MMKRTKWWTIGGTAVVALGLIIGIGMQQFSASAQMLSADEAQSLLTQRYPGDVIHLTKTDGEYEIEMLLETGVYRFTIDAISGEVKSVVRQQVDSIDLPDTAVQQEAIDPAKAEELNDPGRTGSQNESTTGDESQERGEGKGSDARSNHPSPNSPSTHEPARQETSKEPKQSDSVSSGQSGSTPKEQKYLISEDEAIAIAEQYLQGEGDDAELYYPQGRSPYYLVEVEFDGTDDEAIVQIDAITKEIKSVTWEEDDDDDDDDD